jgi:hypothetical protein
MSTDRRDLKVIFGGIALGPNSFPTVYLSKSEVELRRSLASAAYAYGWDVQEEVVIPGWGRIDIVLTAGPENFLIELKLDLTKPAKIRRAFQQADGYGRWWSSNRGHAADVFLCALEMDDTAVAAVAAAYLCVGPKSISQLLAFFEHGGSARGRMARANRAKARAERAAFISEFHAAASTAMAKHLPASESTPSDSSST